MKHASRNAKTRSCTNTRLMRDLSRLMRSDTEKLGFSLQLKDDDALSEWNINLFGFSDCPLAEVTLTKFERASFHSIAFFVVVHMQEVLDPCPSHTSR